MKCVFRFPLPKEDVFQIFSKIKFVNIINKPHDPTHIPNTFLSIFLSTYFSFSSLLIPPHLNSSCTNLLGIPRDKMNFELCVQHDLSLYHLTSISQPHLNCIAPILWNTCFSKQYFRVCAVEDIQMKALTYLEQKNILISTIFFFQSYRGHLNISLELFRCMDFNRKR